MAKVCHQVNFQTTFGGGEVYTRSLCTAIASLGWESRVYVSREAGFWSSLRLQGARVIPVEGEADFEAGLPEEGALVLTHTALSPVAARRISACHRLGGIIHMPLYERDPAGLREYRRLFGVSRHVIDSTHVRGYTNVDPHPLYGVADLQPRGGTGSGPLYSRSVYDWDRRKLRDRALGAIEPWLTPIRSRHRFQRTSDLTIGIVSRLTPIKQFPEMFSLLAPCIARTPGVRLEIFGAGGYATVRDLRDALRPLGPRARFWGNQPDVASVYPQLDWVLSGLPEKEALGLNLIEAQASGTPVLAVDASPFTETVAPGRSGYLFPDPRTDSGAGFEVLLRSLANGELPRPDPRLATDHLNRFSVQSFSSRVQTAMSMLSSS